MRKQLYILKVHDVMGFDRHMSQQNHQATTHHRTRSRLPAGVVSRSRPRPLPRPQDPRVSVPPSQAGSHSPEFHINPLRGRRHISLFAQLPSHGRRTSITVTPREPVAFSCRAVSTTWTNHWFCPPGRWRTPGLPGVFTHGPRGRACTSLSTSLSLKRSVTFVGRASGPGGGLQLRL